MTEKLLWMLRGWLGSIPGKNLPCKQTAKKKKSNFTLKHKHQIHIISIVGRNIRTNIYEENLQNFVCAYLAGLQNMMECFCFIRIEKQMQFP